MSWPPVRMAGRTYSALLEVLGRSLVRGDAWAAVLPSGSVVSLETAESKSGCRVLDAAALLLVAQSPGCLLAHAHRFPPAVLSASDRLGALAGDVPAHDVTLLVAVPSYGQAAAYRWDPAGRRFRLVPLVVSP